MTLHNKSQSTRKKQLFQFDRLAAEFAPLLIDLIAITSCFWLLTQWVHPQASLDFYLYGLPAYLACFFVGAYLTRLYGSWRGARKTGLLLNVFLACLTTSVIFAYLTSLLNVWMIPESQWLLGILLITTSLQGGLRLLLYRLVQRLRLKGINLKSVLLIGHPVSCERIVRSLEHSESGFQFIGQIDTITSDEASALNKLSTELVKQSPDEVWIALPLSEGEQVRTLHDSLQSSTVNVRYLPDFQDFRLLNHQVTELGPFWSVDLSKTPFEGGARIIKTLEDYLLGIFFLVLSLPLMLLIAFAIKLTSPGPVIFKQHRQGLDGRLFKIYKFRTMHSQNEAKFLQAQPGDERVTPLGRLLRKTSMDELPQFFNVLQGRMSIIGPRPHVAVQNSYYNLVIDRYMQRHRVKPGITGWAQVNGLRGITQTDEVMRKRVEYDLYYINNWSLLMDIRIILMTLRNGFINQNP